MQCAGCYTIITTIPIAVVGEGARSRENWLSVRFGENVGTGKRVDSDAVLSWREGNNKPW